MIKLLGTFVLLGHWFGCTFYLMGKLQLDAAQDSWLDHPMMINTDEKERYVASVYWALATMTTVGMTFFLKKQYLGGGGET